jgi:tRNA-specific 2-thiouridylase
LPRRRSANPLKTLFLILIMKKIVFVGISGGVDSAVSAALLKKQGYEVVGVFIRTWHPDFLVCNEEAERLDAMRVAAHLDIPFLTFDLEKVYKKEVADYMIREYKAGRTPNPDVMCNKEVKFGAFLKKAISMGADFVATGHYAEIHDSSFYFELPEGPAPVLRGRAQGRKIGRGGVNLYKNIDFSKDQSYFLWTLKQEQLKKILFPIGYLKKTEVRRLAKKFKLPVAEKKDSQGICFLGAVDLKEFLKHYIKEKRGRVCNEFGEEIGFHDGVFFHTLGERHGFTITKKSPNDKPYYIVGKDIKKNILYVSQNTKQMLSQEKGKNYLKKSPNIFLLKNFSGLAPSRSVASFKDSFCLFLEETNWISEIPKSNKNYTAQIRYHSEFLPCKIKVEDPEHSRRAEIIFKKPVLVASGQSCVLYDKNICLGGGVVV